MIFLKQDNKHIGRLLRKLRALHMKQNVHWNWNLLPVFFEEFTDLNFRSTTVYSRYEEVNLGQHIHQYTIFGLFVQKTKILPKKLKN